MPLSRYRPARLLLTTLLAALTLSACGSPDRPAGAPSADSTFVDDLGRSVTIPYPAERLVTLAPSLTETAFAAGAGERVVGVTSADDFPAAVDTLPDFTALPIDFEAVLALRPELVLATDQVNSRRDAATFEELGIPVAFLSFRSLADVLASIRRVGAMAGTGEQADAAANLLDERIKALRGRTDDLDERPDVLMLIGDETLYAFGQGSYVHDLIELAGGRSATAEFETARPVLTEEFVLTRKPDVIIGAWGEDYDVARLQQLHPTWDLVPAIAEGRVYSIDPDLILRPGPRLVDGAYALAEVLHPALVADLLAEGR